MLVALDITAVRSFSFEDDTDPKTTFGLGLFDLPLRTHFSNRLRTANKDDSLNIINDMVRYGLRTWTLGPALKTTKVEIPGAGTYDAVTDWCLSCLRPEWVTRLANEIMSDNFPRLVPAFNEDAFRKDHPDLYEKYLIGGPGKNSNAPSR